MKVSKTIKNLFYSKYEFRARCLTDFSLPEYKGATFRGGFGHTLKEIVCPYVNRNATDVVCEKCIWCDTCPYSYIFETFMPEQYTLLDNYFNAPRPFIIEPPQDKKRYYKQGDEFAFNIILIGKATEYFFYTLLAMEKLGRIGIGWQQAGKFAIETVLICDNTNENVKHKIYDGTGRFLDMPPLSPPDKKLHSCVLSKGSLDTLEIDFVTPTKIKYNNALIKYPGSEIGDLDFHMFFARLIERLSVLSLFHCGLSMKDFKIFTYRKRLLMTQAQSVQRIKSALIWTDHIRCSNRQNKAKLKYGGFVGRIGFCGDLQDLYPYIVAGETVHVGTGTAFGQGMYRIVKS